MSRSIHYDILRIIACLMVIMTHSPIPHEGWYGPLLSGLSYLCNPCIGLFFMISGALLLNKHYKEPFVLSDFLKKRLSRILFPTLFWFAVGYCLTSLGIKNSERAILWFMYVLAGLYLLTPILLRWLNHAKRREVEFYLLLWGVSLCYPLLNSFIHISVSTKSWIYYFYGYAGYYVLGYYLSKYELNKPILIGFILSFLFFSIAHPLIVLVEGLDVNFYSVFYYLSISIALQCVAWWLLIKYTSSFFEAGRRPIENISKMSFGIYLIHVLVLRNFLWKLSWIQSLSGITQILICTVLTFLLSYLFCWILSIFRFGKYIIGV